MSCGLALLALQGCSSEADEPTDSRCVLDVDCDEGSICVIATNVCTVEPKLCELSADCTDPREFCLPRDEINTGSLICTRAVRCDQVMEDDVSALCRANNGLTGNEQFTCDVSNPQTPTCVRSDNPGGTGGPCMQSSDCKQDADYCLDSGSSTTDRICAAPSTCEDLPLEERDAYCEEVEPGTTCKESSIRGFSCQPEFDGIYSWIWILDRTVETEACDHTEPGADLMGVRVRNVNDDIIGWGSAYDLKLGDSGTQDNVYATADRLNGNANGFADQICPDLNTPFTTLMPPPVSLGCGGSVFIVFFDLNGQPLTLLDNMSIEVLEHGDPCEDAKRDVYSIYMCRDSWGAEQGISESCDFGLGGTQRGFGNVPVTTP